MSQTQLANYAGAAGLLVMLLNRFGIIISSDQIIFIVAALWTLGSQAYSFWNRWKKGDITPLGAIK